MLGKRWWAVAGVLAVAMLVGACGSGSDKQDESKGSGPQGTQLAGQAAGNTTAVAGAQPAGAKVRRGGTLVYALPINPKLFDPRVYTDTYSGEVVNEVFETLVQYDENLKPQPWLAEKYEVSPDGLTYTFTLRKGVKFHDGTEMDAEAVKFSVDRVKEFKTGPAYPEAQQITESTVVDKYTYRLKIAEPNAPFTTELAGRLGTIVSPKAVKEMGDDKFALNPVGTGPFKFKEFKSDNYARVEKNPDYWRMGADGKPLPYLDAVEMRVIPESNTRLTGLQSGDLHIAPLDDQELKIAQKDSNITWAQKPGFSWSSVLLTVTKPPFDNRALRQAVAYGIDREEIKNVIYEGNREVANGPIPPPLEWAIDKSYKPFTYDPAKVKEKLTEGGKPNGFDFTFYTDGSSPLSKRLAELMQQQLKKAGITMNVEYADFNGVVIPKAKAQEPGMFGISFSCSYDPDACIARRFLAGSGFNYMGYDNPKVNELILAARRTNNIEERGKLYKQALPLVVEDVPAVFTVYGVSRYVGVKKVQGWYFRTQPRMSQGFSEYWLSE